MFIHPRGLNEKMPLGKGRQFAKWSQRSAKLTNRYAKLIGAGIPTIVDTSTIKVDMIGSKRIMNGNDNSTGKVDLIKASESQGVDNNLDKDKSTCLKNQYRMTTQSGVAN